MADSRVIMETAEDIYQTALADGKDASIAAMEAFDRMRGILAAEDIGWQTLFSGAGFGIGNALNYGLLRQELWQWAWRIREAMTSAPWIKQGFILRSSYIWMGGIRYGNIPGSKGNENKQGKTNIQRIIDRPGNQKHFFGKEARRQREGCLYSDAVAFWIGDNNTFDIEQCPAWQITDQMLDPDGLGNVIAYRRTWEHRNLETGEIEPHIKWYFTDEYEHLRVPLINVGGVYEPVAQNHVIFDQHANRQQGLAYGAPDALAAIIWYKYARDGYLDGRTMQAALTSIAYKVTSKTSAGQVAASTAFANPQGGASTAVMGQNDLVPLATAGKGFDFSTLRELVAIVAASLSVSTTNLTMNAADNGSSYGSSQTMDMPVRLAMEQRRDEHIALDCRVLRWMGVKDPDVDFVPYAEGDETYRLIQGIIMALDNDLYDRQEIRDQIDDLRGLPNGTVPSEADRPSVKLAQQLSKIQGALVAVSGTSKTPNGTDKATIEPGGGTATPQTASPTQGKSNGTGGQSGAGNDLRGSNQHVK